MRQTPNPAVKTLAWTTGFSGSAARWASTAEKTTLLMGFPSDFVGSVSECKESLGLEELPLLKADQTEI